MFQSFQSFLAFLFALLTVYTLIRAFRLDSLLDPARDFWKRIGKEGRVCVTISVVFLAGHAVSKELLRGGGGNANLPDWFIALQYNPADTDGDGIPDCWERWTRTKPLISDANLDPDGDGVDNFGEFWNQCDPLMKDTDGDGYSDKLEIEGRAAGKTWFNPIVRAVYEYDDPDLNTNDVPDRWEGLGYVYGYTDANNDGLPDGVSFPEYGGGNFEVEVVVSTTRAALLSWGSSTNEAIVLPPCSCLPVRLRLSGFDDTDVRLSCGTAGDGSEGLWYGRLVIRWPEDSRYETEGDRILVQADSIIECEAMEVSFRGEVQTEPRRTPQDDVPTSIKSPFRRKWLHVHGFSGDCWEHGFGGFEFVSTSYTNIAPPFSWYVNDNLVRGQTGDMLTASEILDAWNGMTPVEVRCEWTNSTPHQSLLIEGADTVALNHCPPPTTNIIGVASSSTHNPTNATDHLPCVSNSVSFHFGPNCPPTTNLIVKAGWTHDTEVLWIRNLIRILTGDPKDDETDHCIGLVWSEDGSINLYDYLADCCKPFADKFTYYVNGNQCEGTLEFGDEPEEFHPKAFHIELRDEDGRNTLDRMWVVMNATATKNNYRRWYARYASTSWVNTLPKPYAKLQISTNWLGIVSATPTNPSNPNSWHTPTKLSGYLHHDSKWEMRSHIVNKHSNQACYNEQGEIALSGIAGGTADFAATKYLDEHISEDVNPYLNALHLDGNPGDTGWFNGISRPCLYQGNCLNQYIERRPIVQPEGE